MTQRIFLLTLAVVVTGLQFAVIAYSIPPAYKYIKTWRAEQLAEQSSEYLELFDLFSAYDAAMSALELAPDNVYALRAAGAFYKHANPMQALDYYLKAVDAADATNKDREKLIAVALQTQQFEIALEHIELLTLEDAQLGEKWNIVYLWRTQQKAEAKKQIKDRVKRMPDDTDTLKLYYQQASNDSTASHSQALATLKQHAEKPDEASITALRLIVQDKSLSNEERASYLEMLKNHPQYHRDDLKLKTQLALDKGEISPEAAYKEVLSEYDLDDYKEVLDLGRWLNHIKLHEQTLELISEEAGMKNRHLFLVRIDALASLDRWDHVEALLTRPQIPIRDFTHSLFMTRTHMEKGSRTHAKVSWEKTLNQATGNPAYLWMAFKYSSQIKWYEAAREVLKKLTLLPRERRDALVRWVQLEQTLGNTHAMLKVYKRMIESHVDDPAIRNDIAYLNLLLNQEIDSSLEIAKKLVLTHPRNLSHYITLALAYLKTNEPKDALKTLSMAKAPWHKVGARQRAVAAAVLLANQHLKEAEQLLKGIETEMLIPEEVELTRSAMRQLKGQAVDAKALEAE